MIRKFILSLCVLVSAIFIISACSDVEEETTIAETTTEYAETTLSSVTEPDSQKIAEETTEETISDAENIPGNSGNLSSSIYGEKTGTNKTFTGLEPLGKRDFSLINIRNTDVLSGEMISHSYGIATEEKAHTISIGYQQMFNDKLLNAVCYDSNAEKKVVYLTFDCGYENGYTSKILDTLKEKNVTAAFFCTLPQVKSESALIARMINEGHIVGNHSVTHPNFSALSEAQIIEEISGFEDYIRENFGYCSMFFRFPEGKYTEKVISVINDLGYRCVFWSLAYADWDTSNQKGAEYALDTVISRIHPGAVILLHSVSSDNANALADIIDTARSMGYEFCSLEDM